MSHTPKQPQRQGCVETGVVTLSTFLGVGETTGNNDETWDNDVRQNVNRST